MYGVKTVAGRLTVKPAGEPRDESEIARVIAHILDNNTKIPESEVRAQVRAGWVTLDPMCVELALERGSNPYLHLFH